ncbi:PTS transporter subunit EIIB [Spongorhabdus nitratireducens]
MGFFSKLFGKSEPVPQPQSSAPITPQAQPAPKAPVSIDIDTQAIISELGGKDNIASLQTCAVTRVRVELKAAHQGSDETLKKAGITANMKINETVIHLLAGLEADAVCSALKAEIT